MAIKNKGYGEQGHVGFDDVLTRDDDGRPDEYRAADRLPEGEHFPEVVSLDLWETPKGQDFVKIWLFLAGAQPRLTRMFGEYRPSTAWKWDRAFLSIFGRPMPVGELQGEGGRMPLATRALALGRYVKIAVKNGGYDEQDVIVVDGPYKAPTGISPMYAEGKATGQWPTKADELRDTAAPATTGRARTAAPATAAGAKRAPAEPPPPDDDDW